MFIRARVSKKQTYFQLVRGYRDEDGVVRQETVGLGPFDSVKEALVWERKALQKYRRQRARWSGSSSDVGQKQVEKFDRLISRCESKIARLEAASVDTTISERAAKSRRDV